MYKLYYSPLCPFSRKVRVVMNEKSIRFFPTIEEFWERRDKFIKLNPLGTVPFIISKPDIMISGSNAIIEYFEELSDEVSVLNGSPKDRAEIRRIVNWFDDKFFKDVSEFILQERVFNFFKSGTEPNQAILKMARANIPFHMKYLQHLLSRNNWVGGKEFSLADITAACHISSLDYLGEINWSHFPALKDWYSIVKSRPSFRELLHDNIVGFRPAPHYAELDF